MAAAVHAQQRTAEECMSECFRGLVVMIRLAPYPVRGAIIHQIAPKTRWLAGTTDDGHVTTALCGAMLTALAICIYFVADLMPTWTLMFNNADVMFAEDIARALNAGGRLFDWRLSQVPYLFPDILFARLLVLAGAGATKVASLFQALYPVILLPLVYWLAKACRADAPTAVIFAGFVYLLTYTGQLDGDLITVHFGLIGFHTGALVPVIGALCFAGILTRPLTPPPLGAAGLFLSLFLGLISDSLVGAILLPPIALWLLMLWFTRPEKRQHAIAAAAAIVLAIAFGRLFSALNPFPQDTAFFRLILAEMPASSFRSLRIFFADLWTYTFSSRISAALLFLTLASCVICTFHLARSRKADLPALLALTVVISTPLVITLDLVLGMYLGIGSCRHWAPVVYLAIVAGPLILSIDRAAMAGGITLATGVFVSLQFGIGMAGQRGKLPIDNMFEELAVCMEREKLPEGWLYVSDYWVSRPVRVLSREKFGIVPLTASGAVFTNQANIKWIRSATPRYAITGYELLESDLIKRYGPPRAVFCELNLANVQPVKVLDYSDNNAFKQAIRNSAATAH